MRREFVVALIATGVIAFYAWDAAPGRALFGRFDDGDRYYNLLVRGFRAGHLSLPVTAPPGLLALKDPYDPKLNGAFGMHDVSFYKGKFYLYFGVAPALVLYGPFRVLTGRYLNDPQAVFIFCTSAFLAGTLLLLRAGRRYFPSMGVTATSAAVLAWGFTTMVPVLLRRPEFYEVAVSSAHAFFIASLFALYQSIHGVRKLRWMALASLCYGLAIASRPTYLFGAAGLVVAVWLTRRSAPPAGGGGEPGWLAHLCAAVIPVGLVLAGLMAYNYLRFDNPFEFGHRLALSGFPETKIRHFSPSYFWFNCRAYLLAPAQLSSYFPFVRVVSLPAPPDGHFGVEDPYGILPNIPFAVLALFAPLACANRPKLGVFAASVAVSFLAVASVLFSFGFASNRYMVDFLPALILLAILGFWGLWEHFTGWLRTAVVGACWLALIWSCLFNVFAAFGHNELLRVNNPAVFRRLAHAFGYPRRLLDALTGRTYGPIEMTVEFPQDRQGQLEPLVITGSEFLSDYLYAYYVSRDKLVIGFEHTGDGGPVTGVIPVDFHGTHRLKVDMAPLYPPASDPYFDRVSPEAATALAGSLRVWLDGIEVLDTPQTFFPAFRQTPEIGEGTTHQRALGSRFSGKILEFHHSKPDWNSMAGATRVGPVVVLLEFPKGKAGAREPLLTSGVTGRGDVLVANYIDAKRVTFTLDHWGVGGPTSDPVDVDPGTRKTLEIRFGSFYPAAHRPANVPEFAWSDAAGKLEVLLNHQMVFKAKVSFYDAPPESIAVGRNPIGASSCSAEFSGRIVGFIRGDVDGPARK